MKPSISCKFNRLDLLVAVGVVFCAVGLSVALISRAQDGVPLAAAIRDADGTEYTVALDTPRRIELAQGRVTLLVERDGVLVEYADCPTQSCVQTGKITRAGESIVCLPNRVVVTLEGADAFDAVMG